MSKQPKAFARIGNVRFVLNGTTVTAQERCGPVLLGDHSERHYWHFAGRVGLEALMQAAQHGLRVFFKGSKCWRVNGELAPAVGRHEFWLPAVGRHEFWLSTEQVRQLLVHVDERQETTASA